MPTNVDQVAAVRSRLLAADDLARLSGLLGLLADPVRAAVLYALDVEGDLSAAELAALVDSGEGTIGYALDILAAAGLVTCTGTRGSQRGRLATGFPRHLLRGCLPRLVELTRSGDIPGERG